MPAAPDGFLWLGEAAARFAERLRCSRQKAEYRSLREVTEGKLRLLSAVTLELIPFAEDDQLDFAASEVVPASGGVLHVRISEDGGQSITHVRGQRVVLDADDIERLLNELAPPAPASTSHYPPRPGEPRPPPAPTTPRPPGRPTTYDWASYEAQARRRVHQHGLPEKSSILVAEVMALFGRKMANPPEQRTVEREIAKWWPSLEDLIGPCEITPLSSSRRN